MDRTIPILEESEPRGFPASPPEQKQSLEKMYEVVRAQTEALAAPLSPEDASISVTAETSPAKWHLAHTTWFFERFVLRRFAAEYRVFDPAYDFLFNSYYETLGKFLPKKERPFLSRPSLAEILEYRAYVDDQMFRYFRSAEDRAFHVNLEIGIHHEQQHQELLMMDTKRNFYASPLRPSYRRQESMPSPHRNLSADFIFFEGGKTGIGSDNRSFAYDNESGRHSVWLEPYELSTELVTNGEFLEFVDAGGYRDPKHWLSDGWEAVKKFGWQSPLYWEQEQGRWKTFSFGGMVPLVAQEPVAHLSYFEADAFARWKNCRLPTEQEWEHAARTEPVAGSFLEEGSYSPGRAAAGRSLKDMYGCLWQWTQSAYLPYPGYRPFDGELAEYNGKFFSQQMVLRGGSCVTPLAHYRTTYRNFYYPEMRWQFSGLRLARDAVRKSGRVMQ